MLPGASAGWRRDHREREREREGEGGGSRVEGFCGIDLCESEARLEAKVLVTVSR
jgi:hypothetical protein